MKISVIIPAYNEEKHLPSTINAIREAGWASELIGVNDGSRDRTGRMMEYYCDTTISFIKNQGKSTAAKAGWLASKGDYIVTLDADLRESAAYGEALIQALQHHCADLVIGKVQGNGRNGFGFVKRRVQRMIEQQSGISLEMPLSGQRAFRREHLPIFQEMKTEGFGLETIMNLHAIQQGFRIEEVNVPFVHKGKGWGWQGIYHRGKQWLEVERCLKKYGRSYTSLR
ncbi:glycosyltransferase family 2 protein [Salibacterium aidingense]|uniref:glycosyltransferase family 2 protein n=1 Tax=Salibacterium aidingense TaxID=384933 RepID=UPI00041239F1|nr:glycosyltransferase family 2 protein [Salibacterium aidingense]